MRMRAYALVLPLLACSAVLLARGAHPNSGQVLAPPGCAPATTPSDTSSTPVLVGCVTDARSGAPLPGAAVQLKGTRLGTLSSSDGRYRLPLGTDLLGRKVTVVTTLLGYGGHQRTIKIKAGPNTLDFALTPSAVALEAIALGNAKAGRRDMAAAALTVAPVPPTGMQARLPRDFNTESYATIEENPFLAVAGNPMSTFSIDVDRASYGNVRRFIRQGQLPPRDAVRIEELINYFPYNDPEPKAGVPFAVRTELGPAPWKPAHKLLRIGLQARRVELSQLPPNNLVFLLDVSGSMDEPNKLPLLKQAMSLLVDQLRPQDRLAIVVYAGAAGLVLPSTPGSDKERIRQALESLQAGGSTAGGAGLKLAYEVAAQNHMVEGNNRVVLATDGDFNIGASSDAEMTQLIEQRRAQGTFLTVLGFGTGNVKDSKMESMADHGNGNYAYIDDLLEARKVLVHEVGGTLLTVASDVKIQVEFNPARVAGYRLIGYENRLLRNEDFADDRKDAGELGAGHAVTALYEIVPRGVKTDVELRAPEKSRYQAPETPNATAASDELLFVKLRYKAPGETASRLLTQAVRDTDTTNSPDFAFSAAVAGWGMLLRNSPHRGSASLDLVADLGRRGLGADVGGYRSEFLRLVDATRPLLKGKEIAEAR